MHRSFGLVQWIVGCAYFIISLQDTNYYYCYGLSSISSLPPLKSKTADHLPLAKKCMEYIDASPDPFFAVQTSIDLLQKAGFEPLEDGIPYQGKLTPGGKYYFTRNKSTLVAFTVGQSYVAGNGFKIIGKQGTYM